MPGPSRSRRLVGWFLAVATMPALADGTTEPRQVIRQALAEAVSIPRQAQALVHLAWPTDGPGDPLVAALAREQLVGYGSHGLEALREALLDVSPEHQADVTATLIDARRSEGHGNPKAFLPTLEEAIWYGSIEARRLAIAEISKFLFPSAVLSTIDAIHENPELTLHGIRALGRMRNERSRFFLGRALNHAAPRYKAAAASSLALLGDTGFPVLRNAVRSETRDVREAAVRALLPYAAVEDLTALYDYLDSHGPTDDPQVLELIRTRATQLETVLEEQQLREAASAESDETEPQP